MAASGERNDKTREIVIFLLAVCFGVAVIGGAVWWISTKMPATSMSPSFSIMVTGTGSLDPARGPVIRPAFDVALRVDNPTDSRLCREKATVTVSYGGVVLGWGTVHDFCVGEGASAEVAAELSHADVVLTDRLRRVMASKLQAGELGVSVRRRMLFPRGHQCGICVRDIRQHCRVRPGQGYAPCQCHALEITQISELTGH